MGEFERLGAEQLREAARVLGEWAAAQRHEAEVESEVLDRDGAAAFRERAERVEAVRAALMAEAARREAAGAPGAA